MTKQRLSVTNIFSKICFVSTAPVGPCGGSLKDNTGYITAPDFDMDGYYDFNLFCMWFIQVEQGKVILYQFDFIFVENDVTGCRTDYILVSCMSWCQCRSGLLYIIYNCPMLSKLQFESGHPSGFRVSTT